jgi:hypothetical protein
MLNRQWPWFVVACVLPPAGIIVGIIYSAKDRVGPALALWATSAIAVWLWLAVLVTIGFAMAGSPQALSTGVADRLGSGPPSSANGRLGGEPIGSSSTDRYVSPGVDPSDYDDEDEPVAPLDWTDPDGYQCKFVELDRLTSSTPDLCPANPNHK